MVTVCAFSMMKMSTTMRTRAPAISAVHAALIRLPSRLRRGVRAAAAGGVGAGGVGAPGVDGVGLGAGAGATPLGEAGGKVAACGAGSFMARPLANGKPGQENPAHPGSPPR